MTRYLPSYLQPLFKARLPLEYLPPIEVRKSRGYTGVSPWVKYLENDDEKKVDTKPIEILTPEEIRARRKKKRIEEHEAKISKQLKQWDPFNNQRATEEGYKTLFIARLNYDTTEAILQKEFSYHAPIKTIRIVRDLNGKSRGYAFIELENDKDVKHVYERMNGRVIDGFQILVDVERGRTVNNWRPRRFGNSNNTPRSGNAPPKSKPVPHPTPARSSRDSERDKIKRHHGYRSGREYDRRYRDYPY